MMELRELAPDERMYTYTESTQIMGQSGCIGHLRGDFGFGQEFFTTWNDYNNSLKTQDFKDEFDQVIEALRHDPQYGGILENRGKLSAYLHAHPGSRFPDGDWSGFRVNTDDYSYLMRLNSRKGDYNLYIYCYKRSTLDRHIERAKQGIRFITPEYKELFRVADGDKIRIITAGGENRDRVVRYVDDYHFELSGGYPRSFYHIAEFAQRFTERGCQALIPLRGSLPEMCYSTLLDTGKVVILKRGETGYYKSDLPLMSREEAKHLVDSNNQKLGVSKAQQAAMQAGSMFGFQVPAADPKNYDAEGNPLKIKNKERGNAR